MFKQIKEWFKRPIIYEIHMDIVKIRKLRRDEKLLIMMPGATCEEVLGFKRKWDKVMTSNSETIFCNLKNSDFKIVGIKNV